jgi:hypothetical protein
MPTSASAAGLRLTQRVLAAAGTMAEIRHEWAAGALSGLHAPAAAAGEDARTTGELPVDTARTDSTQPGQRHQPGHEHGRVDPGASAASACQCPACDGPGDSDSGTVSSAVSGPVATSSAGPVDSEAFAANAALTNRSRISPPVSVLCQPIVASGSPAGDSQSD